MKPGRFQQKGPPNDNETKCNENLPLETKTQKRILFFLLEKPKTNFNPKKPQAKLIFNQNPKQNLFLLKIQKQSFLLLKKGKFKKSLK